MKGIQLPYLKVSFHDSTQFNCDQAYYCEQFCVIIGSGIMLYTIIDVRRSGFRRFRGLVTSYCWLKLFQILVDYKQLGNNCYSKPKVLTAAEIFPCWERVGSWMWKPSYLGWFGRFGLDWRWQAALWRIKSEACSQLFVTCFVLTLAVIMSDLQRMKIILIIHQKHLTHLLHACVTVHSINNSHHISYQPENSEYLLSERHLCLNSIVYFHYFFVYIYPRICTGCRGNNKE